jgi:hypothetical protein
MGLIRCPLHGTAFIIPCCEHIADAEVAGTAKRAVVVVDDWGAPVTYVVCEGCERLLSAVERSSDPTGFEDLLTSLLVPHCYECLRDWFGAMGQGDLSELIARLQRRHLK